MLKLSEVKQVDATTLGHWNESLRWIGSAQYS